MHALEALTWYIWTRYYRHIYIVSLALLCSENISVGPVSGGERNKPGRKSQNTQFERQLSWQSTLTVLRTLTLTGLRIFLHWIISVLKYQGKWSTSKLRSIHHMYFILYLNMSDIYILAPWCYHWGSGIGIFPTDGTLAPVPFVALNRAKNIWPEAKILQIWSAKNWM